MSSSSPVGTAREARGAVASASPGTVTVPGGGTQVSWEAAERALASGQRVRLHFDGSTARVLRTEVDVEAYTRRDHGRIAVDTARLAAEEPLTDDLRLALGVLQRLAGSALAESRAMLPTWTGNEARITAFLASWMVERHWQARALRDLLTGDDPVARPRPVAPRTPAGRLRRLHVDRLQPLIAPAWTVLAGEAVTAGHMARMAVQEASLQAALRALAPRLTGETRRVVEEIDDRQQGATDFFTAEAIARVSRSRREARTARVVLALGSPLDGGGTSDPDLPAALAVIGADPQTRAALRRARFEITRLLPGPDLPGRHLRSAGGA